MADDGCLMDILCMQAHLSAWCAPGLTDGPGGPSVFTAGCGCSQSPYVTHQPNTIHQLVSADSPAESTVYTPATSGGCSVAYTKDSSQLDAAPQVPSMCECTACDDNCVTGKDAYAYHDEAACRISQPLHVSSSVETQQAMGG